jgi:glycosyltransferase involved in cell wall biosynthesis
LNPLISVIVPCYNQAQYLDECLQSVLDQTYQNWECIIVNDGSPDHTEEVANKWLEKDPRFRYIDKENGGLSSARNAGIEISQGQWILPLDADDKIGNQYLELASLEFNKDYSIIYSEAELFEGKKGRWNLCEFSVNEMAKQNCIFCSAFFRKSSWEKVRGYDINLIYGLEDWEFWISIIRKVSPNVYKIPEICFYYRVKNVSMIKNLNTDKRKFALDYISIKHVDFFVSEMGNFIELLDYKSQYEIILHNKSYKIFDKYFLKLWQIKEKIKNIFNSNELE